MRVYLDTSILVSSFANDALSSRADRLLKTLTDTVVVSDFGAAEFASALALRVRARFMDVDDARATLADFDAWTARLAEPAETLPSDIAAATGYLRRLDLNLRTADAIHIAITQRIGAMLATFDEAMARSAGTLGIPVVAS